MTKKFCTSCGSLLTEDGRCSNPSCAKSKVVINEAAIKNSFVQMKEQVVTAAKESVDAAQDYMQQSSSESNSLENTQIKDLLGKNNRLKESGKNIVPDCVNADSGEVPIRQYDMVRLRSWSNFHFAEGRLQITNKRILFRTSGRSMIGETSSEYEFALEEIAGITLKKEPVLYFAVVFISSMLALFCASAVSAILSWIGASLSIRDVINVLGIMIVLACMILPPFLVPKSLGERSLIFKYALAFFGLMVNVWIGSSGITMICLLVALYHAFKLIFIPGVSFEIKTKGASSAISIHRTSIFAKLKGEDSGFSHVLPGPDYDKAVKELGALIREVQQTGTYVEK